MNEKQSIENSTLQIVLDNMQSIVYVADVDTYEVIFANKALRSLNESEVVGKKCWEVMTSFPGPCEYCKLKELMGKEIGVPQIWENYMPDMQRWFQLNDSIIMWPDGRKVHLVVATDINSVKNNEESLLRYKEELENTLAQKNENELIVKALSDNTPNSFMFQLREDSPGVLPTIVYISKGVEAMCGIEYSEISGNLWLLLGRLRPEDIANIQNAAALGEAFSVETCFTRPDTGEQVWILFAETPRINYRNETVWDGIATNITPAKLNEKSLEDSRRQLEILLSEKTDSEERLKSLSDNLPNSFVFQFSGIVDNTALAIPYISKGVEAICNMTIEEVMQHPEHFAAMFKPEDMQLIMEHSMSRTSFAVEVQIAVPGKEEPVWILFSGIMRSKKGGEATMDGLVIDITSRKKIEEQLLLSQQEALHNAELLEDIGDNMANSAMYRTHMNKEGSIILDYATGQIEHITGVPIAELQEDLGAFIRKIHPDEMGTVLPRIQATSASLTPEVTEFRYLLDGQTRWYRLYSKGFIQDGQIFRDGLIIDLTEQKELEHQLVSARDQAEESDKLKSTFLANMSHEIRTPMNAIIGFLEFLSQEEDLDRETQREYMRIVTDNANQLLKLIADILDISKIDAGQMRIVPEETSVNVLLQDIKSSMMAAGNINNGSKQVELIVDQNGEDPRGYFTLDSARLRQILNNLIGNAIKFTDKGYVKYGYKVVPEGLRFFVEDTGIGISKEKLEDLGKPFHQLHDTASAAKYGGTGIGLAISINLVKLMGGTFNVSSEMGKGSIFEFTLPCEEIVGSAIWQPQANQSMGADGTPFDLTGRTILIVEDMDANMGYLNTLLRQSNATILMAADGEQAVEMVVSNPQIDMVLMDVRMPGMDGLQATVLIKEIRPELPIIGQTAFVYEEDQANMKLAGFDDFVPKPVNRPELNRKIKQYMPS